MEGSGRGGIKTTDRRLNIREADHYITIVVFRRVILAHAHVVAVVLRVWRASQQPPKRRAAKADDGTVAIHTLSVGAELNECDVGSTCMDDRGVPAALTSNTQSLNSDSPTLLSRSAWGTEHATARCVGHERVV